MSGFGRLQRQLELPLAELEMPKSSASAVTPLLLSLQWQYFVQMQEGVKRYEYRRLFVREPSVAFLYITAPVSAVYGVAVLGTPIVDSVDEICRLAETQRPGSSRAMRSYLNGRSVGYAMPILKFIEIQAVSQEELRGVDPAFLPPQSYILLGRRPRLLKYLLDRVPG